VAVEFQAYVDGTSGSSVHDIDINHGDGKSAETGLTIAQADVRLLHTEKWPHGVAVKGDGRSWGGKPAGRMASPDAQGDHPRRWRQ